MSIKAEPSPTIRLDYANSVLFGCPQKHTAHIQRVQQALAWVVIQQSSVSPLTSTELLKQLHWLPIDEWRIRFKLACLVHKILNTGHPPYLTELLQYHKPSKSTRSSASHLLSVPRHNNYLVLALSVSLCPKYGTPYFFTSANPKHTLPSDVILRRTTLFQPILPLATPVMRPDSLPGLRCYINLLLTYLLTKPTDLGCESACRLLSSTPTVASYSVPRIILILPSQRG